MIAIVVTNVTYKAGRRLVISSQKRQSQLWQTRSRPDEHGLSREVGMRHISCWRNQMETFSALLTLSVGKSPVSGEFPSQRPVTRSFDVSFYLCLCKQSWSWWFETPSRSLWRHCNISNCLYSAPQCSADFTIHPFNEIWNIKISWSTMALVITYCLAAPSYYLNQCWLLISKDMWHWPESFHKYLS